LCADAFPSSPSAISDLSPGATAHCSNQSEGTPEFAGVGASAMQGRGETLAAASGSGCCFWGRALCSALLCFALASLATVVFENRKVRDFKASAFGVISLKLICNQQRANQGCY
jgi:hypothetical protein